MRSTVYLGMAGSEMHSSARRWKKEKLMYSGQPRFFVSQIK